MPLYLCQQYTYPLQTSSEFSSRERELPKIVFPPENAWNKIENKFLLIIAIRNLQWLHKDDSELKRSDLMSLHNPTWVGILNVSTMWSH